nr:MAG TPA: hypothetical protein [Caudoviricetes sp.]
MTIESLMRVLLRMFFHEVVIENRVAHVFNGDDRVGKITFNSQPPFIISVSGMYWVTEKANTIKTMIKFCMSVDFHKYLSSNTIDYKGLLDNVPFEE